MKAPLVSCIIPVFNGERYLAEALDSILAQSYQPLEIIMVDDGSTDGTAAVANNYNGRMRYLWQAKGGEAAARDRGLSVAQGEYIAFLDADDLWHPDKLVRQMTLLRQQPEIDISFTCFKNFWVSELGEEKERFAGEPLDQVQSGWSISTFLAVRTVFERFGSFIDHRAPVPGSESMIWFLRATEKGAVIDILPDVLMFRRLHPANQSRANAVEALLPILKEWRNYQRRRSSKTG